MSAFRNPMDYLGKRDLAFQAGAAQGRRGNLFQALGLWQAPQAPGLMQQDEPRLIAQERAKRQAAAAAEADEKRQAAAEERSFGRNVFVERLKQGGRGELQEERLAQQKETFTDREARLREQHAAELARRKAEEEAREAAAAHKRQEDYAKWLHTKPGQAATKAQARVSAMTLPEPFRTAALARIDAEEGVKEIERRTKGEEMQRRADEAESAKWTAEDRAEEYLRLANEREARTAAAAALRPGEKRAARLDRFKRGLIKQRDEVRVRHLRGMTDEQIEQLALEELERAEALLQDESTGF